MSSFEIVQWFLIVIILLVLWFFVRQFRALQHKLKLMQLQQIERAGQERIYHLEEQNTKHVYVFVHLSDTNIVAYAQEMLERYSSLPITVIYQAPKWKVSVLAKQLPEHVAVWRDEAGVLAEQLGVSIFPSILVVDPYFNPIRA